MWVGTTLAVAAYILAPVPNLIVKRFFSDNLFAGYDAEGTQLGGDPPLADGCTARVCWGCNSGTAADAGYFITAVFMVTGLGTHAGQASRAGARADRAHLRFGDVWAHRLTGLPIVLLHGQVVRSRSRRLAWARPCTLTLAHSAELRFFPTYAD